MEQASALLLRLLMLSAPIRSDPHAAACQASFEEYNKCPNSSLRAACVSGNERCREQHLPSTIVGHVLPDLGIENSVVRYFRAKSRAGVARLDGSLALYVMPCGEDAS